MTQVIVPPVAPKIRSRYIRTGCPLEFAKTRCFRHSMTMDICSRAFTSVLLRSWWSDSEEDHQSARLRRMSWLGSSSGLVVRVWRVDRQRQLCE